MPYESDPSESRQDTDMVLIARRRLTDAMHAMHADQRILVSETLALELDAAWDAYDDAIRDRWAHEQETVRLADRG